MPDKGRNQQEHKKQAKTASIKQKRAEKRAKGAGGADPVAHIKKH